MPSVRSGRGTERPGEAGPRVARPAGGAPHTLHRWGPLAVGLLAGALALALYLGTLAPTVTFADSGELAAAAQALDVAHAPGFPLYLLLGKLFTLLVPTGRIVQRLNAFSALGAAAAVGLLGAALAVGLQLAQEPARRGRQRAHAPPKERRIPVWNYPLALCAALLLATSRTFWEQATLTEVYALNTALAAGLLLLLVLYLRAREQGSRPRAGRLAAGAALLSGLGLGGHLTLLFFAGLVFLVIWLEEGREFWRWKRLLLWAGLFLLGLSVYLYLPIRASALPPLNWGGVTSLVRFWRQVSGRQYQVNFSLQNWGQGLGFFLPRLWAEFTPLPLVLALLGLVRLFRRQAALAWGSVAGSVLVLFYALGYEIAEDQETYYMLFFLLLAVWMGYGTAQVVEWVAGRVRSAGETGKQRPAGLQRAAPVAAALAGLFLLLPLWPLLAHFPLCDRRSYTYAEAYARDVLDNLPANAFVLTRDWNLFSPAYYLQQVEGVRSDVVFVDQELLRRTWYLETLQRRFPWLAEGAGQALVNYRAELVKFEEGLPYDAAVIQARYQELGNALLDTAIGQGRPAFFTGEAEFAYPLTVADRYLERLSGTGPARAGGVGEGHPWVPQALALRLATAAPGALPEEVFVQPALGDGRFHDELTQKTVQKYARFWLWRGLYLQAGGDCAAAVPAYQRALALDAGLELARAGLEQCQP